VLRGVDGTFCSGADLSSVAPTKEVGAAMNSMMTALLDDFRSLSIPKFHLLEGHALGGGAELSTAADFRLMAQDARIRFLQRKMGVCTGWGGTQRLISIVGEQVTRRLLLGSPPLTAATATEIGLVDAVLGPEMPPINAFAIGPQIDGMGHSSHSASSVCLRPLRERVALATGVVVQPLGSKLSNHESVWEAVQEQLPLLHASDNEHATGSECEHPADEWLPREVRQVLDGMLGGASSHPAPLWGALRAMRDPDQEAETFKELWCGDANLEALRAAGRL